MFRKKRSPQEYVTRASPLACNALRARGTWSSSSTWLTIRRQRECSLSGRNWFVFGALADKDVAGIVAPLAPLADRWFIASLDGETPRGLPAQEVIARLGGSIRTGEVEGHAGVASALAAAAVASTEGDRIVAFGSFFVAAAALRWIEDSGTGV